VLLAAARIAADPDDPDSKPVDDPAYSFHDLGQAAAHLTLQAHASGLAAHQFAGFDRDAVATALGVPAHYRVLTGIAIGRHGDPAEVDERLREREERVRRRLPLGETVHAEAWGHRWATS
jgi:nitroreductase